MVTQQPDDNPYIQDHFTWVNKARLQGIGNTTGLVIDRHFIPDPDIDAYFDSVRPIKKLVAALFPDDATQVDLEAIRKKYAKVFLILLRIGKGSFITSFLRYDSLSDQYLPFRVPPDRFPASTADAKFFESFYEHQWEFCARRFEPAIHQQFDDHLILPIIEKEKLGGGGSAVVHKIKLHAAYNKLTRVDHSGETSTDRNTHTFVLKTYNTPDAERYYKNEVDGFWNLSSRGGRNPNIIGFYGSFVRNGTFNVLLEYADRGTLAQYFDTVPPPSSGEDILNFWHELSKTLGALTAIHSVQPRDSATSATSPILQGYPAAFTLHGDLTYISRWHQDLKPSNLLVQSKRRGSPGDCEIKIADLGLSHFKKHVPSQGEAIDKDAYGTRAYGAPECYRADSDIEKIPILVNQSVDIWSLGAIFSAAAVWVVHGKRGLSEYSRRRREETARIHGFRDGDCFHNGEGVLDTVTKIHRDLADDIRSSDHVTGAMVHMVTEEMLIESGSRTSAKSLSYRTKRILQDAETKLRKPTSYTDTSSLSGNIVRSPPRTPPEPPPGHHPYSSRKSQSQNLPSPTYTGSLMNTSYNGNDAHHQEPVDDSFGKGSYQQAHHSGRPILRPSPGLINLSYEDQDQFSETHMDRDFSGHGHLQDNPFSSTWNEPHFTSRRPRRTPSGFVPGAEIRVGIDTSCQDMGEINDDSPQFAAAPRGASRSSTSTLVHNPIHSSRLGQRCPNIPSRTRPPRLDLRNVPLPVADQQSRRPAYLSVIHAQQWKSDRKQHRPSKLPHGDHLADLKDRDHVFLIDNSSSMGSNRKEVCDLLGLLAYIVKRTDPDGIEMRFTMSPERRTRARDTGPLLRTLETAPFSGESNIRTQVGEIFQDYHAKLRDQKHTRSLLGRVRSPRPIRRQNVYIFTDGVWQPNCDPTDLIQKLVKGLEQKSMNREQFGIQFIRFGDDPEGIKRLNHLDSGLGLDMDIVDTEPSNGNVWKMLLGAINNWFDDDVHASSSPVASPSANTPRGTNAFSHSERRSTHT